MSAIALVENFTHAALDNREDFIQLTRNRIAEVRNSLRAHDKFKPDHLEFAFQTDDPEHYKATVLFAQKRALEGGKGPKEIEIVRDQIGVTFIQAHLRVCEQWLKQLEQAAGKGEKILGIKQPNVASTFHPYYDVIAPKTTAMLPVIRQAVEQSQAIYGDVCATDETIKSIVGEQIRAQKRDQDRGATTVAIRAQLALV